MQKSNFREWTLDKIEDSFGLVQADSLPILDELLAFEYVTNDVATKNRTVVVSIAIIV
jgi:hypothetical protein